MLKIGLLQVSEYSARRCYCRDVPVQGRTFFVWLVAVLVAAAHFPRVASAPTNHVSSARSPRYIIVSLRHPTPRGPLTSPPEPILMLTKLQPLRATLLQLTSTTRTCVLTLPLLPSCALQTMAAKPSLQAAEDFLSFVNASPTRRSSVMCLVVDG